MSPINPLPFRIKVPGHDTIGAEGVVSISIKLEGLLHLNEKELLLEWTATRTVESVSLEGVRDEVDQSPVGSCEIPLSDILEASVRGGWWAPRLELRARSLEAFEDIPTAENGIAKLRIRRSDRQHAKGLCAGINDPPPLLESP